MARVTVEDCLRFVTNRYELVHLCTKRTRQLFRGADRLVQCKNNEVVTALREIASGKVRFHIQPLPSADAAGSDHPGGHPAP